MSVRVDSARSSASAVTAVYSSMDAAVHLKSSLHSGISGAVSRTSRAASGTAIPAPKASKPKPGDRVVYLMHDGQGRNKHTMVLLGAFQVRCIQSIRPCWLVRHCV